MRFLEKMIKNYNTHINVIANNIPEKLKKAHSDEEGYKDFYDMILLFNRLLAPETQRLIVDQRQAMAFFDADNDIPDMVREYIYWPFEQFWLEFTAPVNIGDRSIWGMLVVPIPKYNHEVHGNWYNISYFYAGISNFNALFEGNIVDSNDTYAMSFQYDMNTGATKTIEPVDNGIEMELCSRFLDYLSSYMVAKGIEVVQEPISRQQRRLLARKALPNPWHVIRVNPVIRENLPPQGEDDGYVRRHGYRYDVMGHLRFGKHKLKDGSYKTSIEWVKPHQRGLMHEKYIPATRKFTGKKPDLLDKVMCEI